VAATALKATMASFGSCDQVRRGAICRRTTDAGFDMLCSGGARHAIALVSC